MSEESQPKTLYVGNLDASVSEDLLCTLFSQIGPVKGCKIIREPGNDPYAFVEFTNHQSASTALAAMNKRSFLDKEMKVNWATSPGNQPKTDTSNHHHIFVGDLSPEIETDTLREAFAPFGEISNCRIVRDPQTLKSKGYAFVSFVKKAEAENAIQAMNGQWLGSRSIRTNWSTRKPPPPRSEKPATKGKQPTFEEDIRVFKDKGYAFIRFANKESATHAIENIHNTEINGQIVKCFWGKENGGLGADSSSMQQGVVNNVQATQYPYGYGQYWYPQGAYPQGYMQGYAYQYPYPAGQQYCVMPQQGQWSAQGGQQPNTTPMMYAAMQKYPSQ
ncbi:eukaryotic translation initiation factor 3 subunit g [Holotrichia oblita]|uniref:Eukaryotic translation initiation factor 3 subunit g n=1 Tax=Holotrichia oblita TaxID=644536 RepID=A0ACB9TQU7_HOLOL|nr:eukaryotic translation initiation factor 3 subunit g [Holotrichia oblita]